MRHQCVQVTLCPDTCRVIRAPEHWSVAVGSLLMSMRNGRNTIFPLLWVGRVDMEDAELGGVTDMGDTFWIILPRQHVILSSAEQKAGVVQRRVWEQLQYGSAYEDPAGIPPCEFRRCL